MMGVLSLVAGLQPTTVSIFDENMRPVGGFRMSSGGVDEMLYNEWATLPITSPVPAWGITDMTIQLTAACPAYVRKVFTTPPAKGISQETP